MDNPIENFVDVKVKHGILRGKVNESGNKIRKFYSFTGVPFAEPPTGPLRFKDPQPLKPWNGIKTVTDNDDVSFAQFSFPLNKVIGSEELVLNVYTPYLPTHGIKAMPVMVFIHYGGFQWGSGCRDECGPDYLIEKDVVYVTINYRLGVFGFLCLDIPECSGNLGLKDQVFGLKWVKENIRSFNGDPNNVTIFGASAGAAAIAFHLLSPMSKGLFHKAIVHSGHAIGQWSIQRNPTRQVSQLLQLLGIKEYQTKDILSLLRSISAEEIIAAYMKIPSDVPDIFFSFAPVVEKEFPEVEAFLIEEPIYSMLEGHFTNVPTIIGYCGKEGIGIGTIVPQHYEDLRKHQRPDSFINIDFDDNARLEIRKKIFSTYEAGTEDLAIEFLGDLDISAGVFKSTKYLAKSNPNVYAFHFCYDGSSKYFSNSISADPVLKGVTHLDDLGYLMSANFLPKNTDTITDYMVRERMIRMWTNFSKCGNPTPTLDDVIDVKWKPVKDDEYNCLEIGSEIKLLENPFQERRNLWDLIYSYRENLITQKEKKI